MNEARKPPVCHRMGETDDCKEAARRL